MNEEDEMPEASENKYGTTPYSATQRSNLGEEPRSSKLTKSLIWPLLALNVIITVLGLIHLQTVDTTEYYNEVLPPDQAQGLTPEMVDTMHTWTIISFIGFGALSVILFLIVGLGLRATKTWARFMGIVFAVLFILSEGLSLLFTVNYGELQTLELFNAVLSWVAVLLTIWWIVQAMNKQTAQWFGFHRRLQH
ncbi:MAG: hypothetical protein L0K07_09565 [Yaniella sp.]|uniref:hypothetical protein n=2 Tax=Yaniella sp. TaxID=2773929 RepID=UPI0026489FC4|nr:hypothetical protein [Yaniella sp.]MDN5731475.1 hypothetical protein [Yaniella sp.]MDN5911876.1 hypothetical protein [Yaniella sp.]MDN6148391.1 hypothetical protein [Yaniella sp.]MDN6411607.1 hypothetical protein [Yaniella sp.]MDN6457554.1 hypothetical protein [Yaniella sp.]